VGCSLDGAEETFNHDDDDDNDDDDDSTALRTVLPWMQWPHCAWIPMVL
jgi:hypothetical protein